MKVIADQAVGVPREVTAQELGVHHNTVSRDRAIHDPELDAFRREIFLEFREDAKRGLRKGMKRADSGIINGWMKGNQVYQERSEVEHSGGIALLTQEELDAKREVGIAGTIGKVRKART